MISVKAVALFAVLVLTSGIARGDSLQFDNGRLDLPNLNIPSGDFTIDLVLQQGPNPDWLPCTKGGLTAEGILMDAWGNASDPVWVFNIAWDLRWGGRDDNGTLHCLRTGFDDRADGLWHHYAVERAGQQITLYRDGVSVAGSITGDWDNSGEIVFGTEPVGWDGEYNGGVAGIRVSSIARYNGNYTVPTDLWTTDSNTVVLYGFTDGTGLQVADHAGGPAAQVILSHPLSGNHNQPVWSTDDPWGAAPPPPPPPPPPPVDCTPPDVDASCICSAP